VHSKKALDVRIGRPFTKRIVRWDWTKHSDKAQGPPVVSPWPVVIAISQEGPISPGRKRSLIPALRAFARWSLVPSASAPVGRLCDNSSAAMGAEERRRNGAPCGTASAHPLGGGCCCQFTNLLIRQVANVPTT
jgi:hypothetical protein